MYKILYLQKKAPYCRRSLHDRHSDMTDIPEAIHVYALPYENKRDAYVRLWRTSLESAGMQVHPLPGTTPLSLVFAAAPPGKRIICIHWSTALYGSAWMVKSLALLKLNILALYLLKWVRGYRVAWVVHNEYAHDYAHPAIDQLGRQWLRIVSDVLIVQQESTRDRYQSRYPRKKIVYIPSGCYQEVYGSPVRPTNALREKYGWKRDDVVVLSFGLVRPYKRTEAIIDAIHTPGVDPRVRLWIVGKAEAAYEKKLRSQIGSTGNVVFDNRYVDDAELPELLSVADYAVFYYDASEMTSGGMRLALSYGLPVMARRIPATEILRDGVNGFVFEDEKSLATLVQSVPPPPSATAVMASVAAFTWARTGREMKNLFASL
jgi:glycosyltransferase involved in cell wall biosynthesis